MNRLGRRRRLTDVLVGREGLVDHLVDRVGRHAARFLLAGPAGVGKSAVTRACTRRLRQEAADTEIHFVELWASPALGELPFGVLGAHVGKSQPGSLTLVGAVESVSDSIARNGTGRRLVIVIDDWQLLDTWSVAVIDRLVERHGAAVLATLRTDEQSGDAEASLHAREWEFVVLRELDRDDVIHMAGEMLGDPLSETSANDLWLRSRGNPLFVRELLVHGLETGSLQHQDGVWRFTTPVNVPSRVSDMISLRLARLTSEQCNALGLLAVAGELPRLMAESLIGPATIAKLEPSGWIRAEARNGDDVIGVGHPLVDESIRASISPIELMTTSRRLAVAARDSGTTLDILQIARWHLVGGVDAADAVWLAAARRARVLGQLDLATQFAEHASDPRSVESLALVEIVTTAGDFRRAEAIAGTLQTELSGILTTPSIISEPRSVDVFGIVALSRAFNAYWGIGDLALAASAIDEALATLGRIPDIEGIRGRPADLELQAERAAQLAFSGSLERGLACADAVLAIDCFDPRVETRARFAAGIALMQLGRPLEATTSLRAGLATVDRIPTYGRDQFTTFLTSALALALIECGDANAAVGVATDGMRAAAAAHDSTRRSLAGFALGRVELARGHADPAAAAFAEAAELDLAYRAVGRASWSIAGLARAEALRGATERSAWAIDEIALLPTSDDRFWFGELARADAWGNIGSGAIPAGIAALERGYALARDSGHRAMAAWLAHDLLRVRGGRGDVERMVHAAASLDQGIYPLLCMHARALRGDDESLRECADAFAAGGFELIAAEVWFTLADRLRGSRRRDAAKATALGNDLLATCGSARTPALVLRFDIDGLTRRQRQIVDLAASGLGNADIAKRLGLSVRTVANQLQRAYEVTGLTRRELPKLA